MKGKGTIRLAVMVLLCALLAGCAQVGPASGDIQGSSSEPSSASSSEFSSGSGDPGLSSEPQQPPVLPWYLTLVNQDNPLPVDFTVPELTELSSGMSIDSRAYPALQEMMDAARADGLEPLICSSFRTRDYQENLYREEIQRYEDRGLSPQEAEAEASRWVALPGTSEHELGLAVDIVDVEYQILDESQEETQVQQWLIQHCCEYGFILRYPTDRSEVTGIAYEPWHYRFVGREAARAITESGLTLEEYLETITTPEQIPPL